MIAEIVKIFGSINAQKINGLVILILLFLILFPFIDENLIQPNKINQEIKNLVLLSDIDKSKLKENPELEEMYNRIISSMNDSNVLIRNKSTLPWWLKFLSGGSAVWLLLIIIPFAKFGDLGKRILAIIMLVVIGVIMGGIGLLQNPVACCQ